LGPRTKLDGFRIIARRVNDVVRLQTKQGYDYAERYPRIVEAEGLVNRFRR
jgi:ATP-dependent DNA ligase